MFQIKIRFMLGKPENVLFSVVCIKSVFVIFNVAFIVIIFIFVFETCIFFFFFISKTKMIPTL